MKTSGDKTREAGGSWAVEAFVGHAAESNRKRGAMKPGTPKMCGDEGTAEAHKSRCQTAKYNMFFLPFSTFIAIKFKHVCKTMVFIRLDIYGTKIF